LDAFKFTHKPEQNVPSFLLPQIPPLLAVVTVVVPDCEFIGTIIAWEQIPPAVGTVTVNGMLLS
jgi:hypothetical protein